MTILTNLNKTTSRYKAPAEKKCPDCSEVKPVKEFKKDPGYKDGRFKRCRECEKKRVEAQKVATVNKELFEHDKFYSF